MSAAPLYICALEHLEMAVERLAPSHLVSAINLNMMPKTPPSLKLENHLKLIMNDIQEPVEGLVLPENSHIARLVHFARSWDRRAPMLIHCWAGISRSSASAYIVMCAISSKTDEISLARTLRKASGSAVPNRKLVALADIYLNRNGRMLAGLNAMGAGDYSPNSSPYPVQF